MALIDQQNKINEMYRKIPDQSAAAAANIGQVEDVRDELVEQADAIEEAILDVAEAEMRDYLENTKMAEVGGDTVTYGPDFGTIDYSSGGITDFTIDATGVPIYEYLGVGWDGDTTITGLIGDYAYGNDALTKPLDTGGTYGIYANISQLDTGLGVLNANKAKLDAGEDVLSRYLP